MKIEGVPGLFPDKAARGGGGTARQADTFRGFPAREYARMGREGGIPNFFKQAPVMRPFPSLATGLAFVPQYDSPALIRSLAALKPKGADSIRLAQLRNQPGIA